MTTEALGSKSYMNLTVAIIRWSVATLAAAAVMPFAVLALLYWATWLLDGIRPEAVRSETVWLATTLNSQDWSSLVSSVKKFFVASALGVIAYRTLVSLITVAVRSVMSRRGFFPRMRIGWSDRALALGVMVSGVIVFTLTGLTDPSSNPWTCPASVDTFGFEV